MPSRCPTCGVYRTLRRLTGERPETAPPTGRERRKIEYVYTALAPSEREDVCGDCRTTLGVGDPPARAATGTEVVAGT